MSPHAPKKERSNASLAWVQHFLHHLAPHGMAGFVLANGPAAAGSSNQSGSISISKFRLHPSNFATAEKLAWYRTNGILPHTEGGGPKGTLIISEVSLKGAISSPEILSLIKAVF